MDNNSPFQSVPPVVVAIFALMVGIEAVLALGGTGVLGVQGISWRITAIDEYAYAPRVLELIQQGRWDFDLLKRFVTYAFVHGSFTHALFGAVLWIALGNFAAGLYRPWAVLVIFLVSVVASALCYGIYGLWIGGNTPLIGAYPADFGMIGAFTYVSWLRLSQQGGKGIQAFAMIGTLMGLQLIYSVLFGSNPTWVADLSGFIAGGITAILVAPGGWSGFLRRIRQR